MFDHGEALLANFEDGRTLDTRAVVGSSAHPDLWTLHARVHQENPEGVFAPQDHALPATPTE
jgi:hypothetical protein